MPDPTQVFISYSHDSEAHTDWVRQLGDRLTRDGLHVELDQYVHPWPAEGWPLWMEKAVEKADFVLVVCTPGYLDRYRLADPAGGRGVAFEGAIITQTLYDAFGRNHKFIPILPETGQIDDIPLILKRGNHYRLWPDYDNLYRVLTSQPATPRPSRGPVKPMPPKPPGRPASASDSPPRRHHPRWLLVATLLLAALLAFAWTQCAEIQTHGDQSPVIQGNIQNSTIQIDSRKETP